MTSIPPSPEAQLLPAGAMVLTVRQVAVALQIGESLCWKLIHSGDIPHIKLGRAVRVRRSDLLRVIEGRTSG